MGIGKMNNSQDKKLTEQETLKKRLIDLSEQHSKLTIREIQLSSEHREVSEQIEETCSLLSETKKALEESFGVSDIKKNGNGVDIDFTKISTESPIIKVDAAVNGEDKTVQSDQKTPAEEILEKLDVEGDTQNTHAD